jgi:hypothetical protein
MTTFQTEILTQRMENVFRVQRRTESCVKRRTLLSNIVEMVVVGLAAKRWNTLTPLIQF